MEFQSITQKVKKNYLLSENKPIFPNKIIPWSEKFTDNTIDFDVEYEEIEINSSELDRLYNEPSVQLYETEENKHEETKENK